MLSSFRFVWSGAAVVLFLNFVISTVNGGDDRGVVPAPRRPNVLFIVSDDLNTHLGCYGVTQVKTPNLDRLAAGGVRFDRAYCQFPLCNPSRASFLTGMRPDTTGVDENSTHFRDNLKQAPSLPQWFRQNGYHTARVGKVFHASVPREIGENGLDDDSAWDETYNPSGRDRADEHLVFNTRPLLGLGGSLSWLAADGDDVEQTDGMAATAAIELLRQSRNQPMFLAVGFFRPHTPFVAPRKYFDLYPLDEISLPSQFAGNRNDVPDAAFAIVPPKYENMDADLQRQAIQAYYASVSFMDAQVGRLLDALDGLGQRENTIVVFLSDHGFQLGEHGVWQKQMLFEESARVPLIVSAPGMSQGRPAEGIVELVDLFPTLADLSGLSLPDGLDGKSFSGQLQNPQTAGKSSAFTQVRRMSRDGEHYFGRSVRTNRYRYIEWDDGRQGVELYDHERDPHEQHNLAGDADLLPVLQSHSRLLPSLSTVALSQTSPQP